MFEQVSVIFKLEEHLVSLARDHQGLAVILILILLIIGTNVVIAQAIELKKFIAGSWVRSRLFWIGAVAFIGAMLFLSVQIVGDLKESAEPVPKIVEDSTTAIGQPLRLQWTYQRPSSRFEIESSKNYSFSDDRKRQGYRNGNLLQVENVNDIRYWRVRAVDSDNRKLSGWSKPVQIANYDSSLIRIRKTGFVTVFMSDSINEAFFKFEMKDANSTLRGYDVAIANEVVRNLGSKLKIASPLNLTRIHVTWQELLSAPTDGRADMIISTITASSDREEKFGLKFSKPYYCTTQSIVSRSSLPAKPQVAQIIANRKIGAQSQTTSENLLKEFVSENPGVQSVTFKQTDDMISALMSGQIDYGFTDTPFARAAQKIFRGLEVRELIEPSDFPKAAKAEEREQKYAIAVRAGEDELIAAIDQIVDGMREHRLSELVAAAVRDFSSRGGPQDVVTKHSDPSNCRAD